jgi:O-acetyl-ADP-ribose deacetylase (regulator of RNase III)
MERVISGLRIECVQGDITKQADVDAVVNAANAQLLPGGGVAGAIHGAAGPGLAEEAVPLGPIRPGQAVITGGHGLPNPHVIHCLGPVYGVDTPSDTLLAECHRNALALAEERKLSSIAFPAISTGIFGYPVRSAAKVAVAAVAMMAPELRSVRLVRFVLWGQASLAAFEAALQGLEAGPDGVCCDGA